MNLIPIFMRRAAVWLTFLTLPIGLFAAETSDAAQTIPTSLRSTVYSATTLFNQANAFARQGKTGLAVLNYERARLLAPEDVDIAANLHLMRVKADLPEAPESWLSRTINHVRPNTAAWLGCCGLILIGTSLLVAHCQPQRRPSLRAIISVSLVLVALAAGSAIVTHTCIDEAVVTASEAPARNSPVASADTAFTLRAGEIVTVRAQRPDFSLVQTPDGRSGWLTRAELSRVVPESGATKPIRRGLVKRESPFR